MGMERLQALEHKFCGLGEAITVEEGARIAGYASVFGAPDQGGDVVAAGAYGASLERIAAGGRAVKLLWQHDPAQPIGVWDTVREDARGLYVEGRLLTEVARAREAAHLIEAGAVDGLSIGYRTVRAGRDEAGRRVLMEIELWEVSLVTFPMLPDARIGAKTDRIDGPAEAMIRDMAAAVQSARRRLAHGD